MLAIIIPFYKLAFFEATLESLANQTDKRFTVYIGDDSSPENPALLLEKFKGQFNFNYHRFESNLGSISLTQQWDRCIALSNKEEWLMILGDDDYLDSTVIASWYKNYAAFNEKTNIVRFASKVVLQETNSISDIFINPVWESAADSFERIFKGLTRSSLSEYIFKKSSYDEFGFKDYPLAWCSDYKAILDFSAGKLIYSINESVVFFRISSINISGQENSVLKKETNIQFFKEVIIHHLNLFSKKQKLDLLMAYEVAIKKGRKPSMKEWRFIVKNYLLNFKLVPFSKSIRRFFISIFKK